MPTSHLSGAAFLKAAAKSSTLRVNSSASRLIFSACFDCSGTSPSLAKKPSFLVSSHSKGAFSSLLTVSSATGMWYLRSRLTMPRSGSKSSSTSSLACFMFCRCHMAVVSCATLSPSTSALSPLLTSRMRSSSSARQSSTVSCRCCVYANIHLVTHVESACLAGRASTLSQPRVADTGISATASCSPL